jgi:translation elongation factor EF-4
VLWVLWCYRLCLHNAGSRGVAQSIYLNDVCGYDVTQCNAEFPEHYDAVEEPVVMATIVAPLPYTGTLIQLAVGRRAELIT